MKKRRRRAFLARRERNVIRSQSLKYIGHDHCPNTTLTKKMRFAKSKRP